MAIHMFQTLIDILKKDPRKIVFTEGSDPRILEASARLLSGNFLTPIPVSYTHLDVYKRQAEVRRIRPDRSGPGAHEKTEETAYSALGGAF